MSVSIICFAASRYSSCNCFTISHTYETRDGNFRLTVLSHVITYVIIVPHGNLALWNSNCFNKRLAYLFSSPPQPKGRLEIISPNFPVKKVCICRIMASSDWPFMAMLIPWEVSVCQVKLGAWRSETSDSAFQELQLLHRGQCEPHDVIYRNPRKDSIPKLWVIDWKFLWFRVAWTVR